jgi:hypothetical protein
MIRPLDAEEIERSLLEEMREASASRADARRGAPRASAE